MVSMLSQNKIEEFSQEFRCKKCNEKLVRVKKSRKNVSAWQTELAFDKGYAFICPQKCRI